MSTYFKSDERIECNGKFGAFIREIVPQGWARFKGYPVWCLVQFDGNKCPSRVLRRDIKAVSHA